MNLRSTITLMTIFAAALPALLIGYPLVAYIKYSTQTGAMRELRLTAAEVAGTLSHDLDLIVTASQSAAADGDIQRALSSVLFVGRADRLLEGIRVTYTEAESLLLMTRDGAVITGVPVTASTETPPAAVVAEVRAMAGGPSGIRSLTAPDVLHLLVPIQGLMGEVAGALVVRVPAAALVTRGARELTPPTALTLHPVADAAPKPEDGQMTQEAKIVLAGASAPLYAARLAEPESHRLAPVKALSRRLSLLVAIAAAALGITAWFMARRALAPVGLLEAHVRRVAAGDYEAPVPDVPFAELKAFAHTLQGLGRAVLEKIRELTEKERARAALERAQIQAELDAMRSQMNPHFLFNSLNSVSTMAAIDTERAQGMITRLADLYRGILESSRAATGPLPREVEIATNYLELERMRFGKRLTFSVHVDEAARSAYLPGLLLQTLAENAVKHGIGPAREGGTVTIDVTRRDDGWFDLAVTNTGAKLGDPDAKARHGTGTGVANTRRRLDLLYGARHGFALTTDAQGRTVARFSFSGEKIDESPDRR